MTSIMRAVRFRHDLSVALVALSVSVTAGCVVVASCAESVGRDDAAVLPLAVLGAVAFAQLGAVSVEERRHELALAELRGQFGRRLLWSALGEPVWLLGAGTVGGLLLGWLLARLILTPGAGTLGLGTTARALSVGILAGVLGAVVVLVVLRRATTQPLAARLLSTARRPAPAAGASFGAVLVLLGAVVAVYETRATGISRHGWLGYLSPTLVGLAAAQIGVWLMGVLARAAAGFEPVNRSVGRLLTARRLARVADRPGLVRIVVAAVVVASVGGSAWIGAASWRDATARTRTGGSVTYVVPGGPFQAYAASHGADPGGRWLMAMSAAPGATTGSARGVFVDSRRWLRVVGDFYGSTPIAQVSPSVTHLASAPAPGVARGRTFTVTLSTSSARRALLSRSEAHVVRSRAPYGGYGFHYLAVVVGYVDAQGDDETLEADLHGTSALRPAGPGRVAYSVPIKVPGATGAPCAHGCSVTSVEVQGLTHGALHVTGLAFGSQQLIPPSRSGLEPATSRWVDAAASSDGLRVELRDAFGTHPLLTWPRPDPLPTLTTAGIAFERERRMQVAPGLDGAPVPVRRLATVTVLPLVGREGLLLDLPTALRGAGGKIPSTDSFVVARADTPPSVLTRLRATGAVGAKHTLEQTRIQVDRAGAGRGTVLYLWVAAFCLLIAAISVVSTARNQRRERIVEAAALRVAGIDKAEIASAHRDESLILGLVVLVVSAAGGWVCGRALLDVLPLADPGSFGVPFDAHPPLVAVLGLAAAAGLFVATVSFLALRTVARSSPPQLLREEA